MLGRGAARRRGPELLTTETASIASSRRVSSQLSPANSRSPMGRWNSEASNLSLTAVLAARARMHDADAELDNDGSDSDGNFSDCSPGTSRGADDAKRNKKRNSAMHDLMTTPTTNRPLGMRRTATAQSDSCWNLREENCELRDRLDNLDKLLCQAEADLAPGCSMSSSMGDTQSMWQSIPRSRKLSSSMGCAPSVPARAVISGRCLDQDEDEIVEDLLSQCYRLRWQKAFAAVRLQNQAKRNAALKAILDKTQASVEEAQREAQGARRALHEAQREAQREAPAGETEVERPSKSEQEDTRHTYGDLIDEKTSLKQQRDVSEKRLTEHLTHIVQIVSDTFEEEDVPFIRPSPSLAMKGALPISSSRHTTASETVRLDHLEALREELAKMKYDAMDLESKMVEQELMRPVARKEMELLRRQERELDRVMPEGRSASCGICSLCCSADRSVLAMTDTAANMVLQTSTPARLALPNG